MITYLTHIHTWQSATPKHFSFLENMLFTVLTCSIFTLCSCYRSYSIHDTTLYICCLIAWNTRSYINRLSTLRSITADTTHMMNHFIAYMLMVTVAHLKNNGCFATLEDLCPQSLRQDSTVAWVDSVDLQLPNRKFLRICDRIPSLPDGSFRLAPNITVNTNTW